MNYMGMTECEQAFDAFRFCVTKPDCGKCPWHDKCYRNGNRHVSIPTDLALAVIRELAELLNEGEVGMSKWIHIRDKVQDEGTRVLICGKRGGISIAMYVPESKNFWCNAKHVFIDAKHWMPLPEPVKGVRS